MLQQTEGKFPLQSNASDFRVCHAFRIAQSKFGPHTNPIQLILDQVNQMAYSKHVSCLWFPAPGPTTAGCQVASRFKAFLVFLSSSPGAGMEAAAMFVGKY